MRVRHALAAPMVCGIFLWCGLFSSPAFSQKSVQVQPAVVPSPVIVPYSSVLAPALGVNSSINLAEQMGTIRIPQARSISGSLSLPKLEGLPIRSVRQRASGATEPSFGSDKGRQPALTPNLLPVKRIQSLPLNTAGTGRSRKLNVASGLNGLRKAASAVRKFASGITFLHSQSVSLEALAANSGKTFDGNSDNGTGRKAVTGDSSDTAPKKAPRSANSGDQKKNASAASLAEKNWSALPDKIRVVLEQQMALNATAWKALGQRARSALLQIATERKTSQLSGTVRSDADDQIFFQRLYPRVIFLLDVFDKPVSNVMADYIDQLLDAGVHIVYLTWRPNKGKHSAEEILLNRLRNRRDNRLMVVSYNGAKISLHSKAKEPKSVIEDEEGLPEAAIETFRQIKGKVQTKLQITGELTEFGLPDIEKNPLIYGVQLPALKARSKITAQKVASEYNAFLRRTSLPYRMAVHPDNPNAIITQAIPLRFSLGRVYSALEARFKGEELVTRNSNQQLIIPHPKNFLVLTDSKRSPKFSRSFPRGVHIHVIKNSGAAEEALGSVLGKRTLTKVNIKLGQLRQYIEYWLPGQAYKSGDRAGGAGGAFVPKSQKQRQYEQKLAMYSGSIIYNLMAGYYAEIHRGQVKNLEQLRKRLSYMWRNPIRAGIRINKPMAQLMRTKTWIELKRGYFRWADAWLVNFWNREFGRNFWEKVQEIQENLVSVSVYAKNLITVEFVSQATGRRYYIHTRPARVQKSSTGDRLTAYVYRTGKDKPGHGEEIQAKVLAMALLAGYGRMGPDGKWHHGNPDGQVISKLIVQFECRTCSKTQEFKPSDFYTSGKNGELIPGPIVQEVTGLIEKMQADEDFQAYYEKEQEAASKKDLKKKKKKKTTNGDKETTKKTAADGKSVAGNSKKQASKETGTDVPAKKTRTRKNK